MLYIFEAPLANSIKTWTPFIIFNKGVTLQDYRIAIQKMNFCLRSKNKNKLSFFHNYNHLHVFRGAVWPYLTEQDQENCEKLISIKKRKDLLKIITSFSWKLECLLWLPSLYLLHQTRKAKYTITSQKYIAFFKDLVHILARVVVTTLCQWKVP